MHSHRQKQEIVMRGLTPNRRDRGEERRGEERRGEERRGEERCLWLPEPVIGLAIQFVCQLDENAVEIDFAT
jgi:hypothetical protein